MGLKGEKGDPNGIPGLPGRDGHDGLSGPVGEKAMKGDKADAAQSGGTAYVCWGMTTCPSGQGTELLYSGRGAGSHFDHTGGGANHLCMSEDPDNMQYASGVHTAIWNTDLITLNQ